MPLTNADKQALNAVTTILKNYRDAQNTVAYGEFQHYLRLTANSSYLRLPNSYDELVLLDVD